MANLKERNIRSDEASKMGREKAKDQPSFEERIDQGGGHVKGEHLGNMGNQQGLPPLTEQEKRNRGQSAAPKTGEGAWRGPGADTRPSENQPERLQDDIGIEDRSSRNGSEVRPTHP
jgi:hypothetical protein